MALTPKSRAARASCPSRVLMWVREPTRGQVEFPVTVASRRNPSHRAVRELARIGIPTENGHSLVVPGMGFHPSYGARGSLTGGEGESRRLHCPLCLWRSRSLSGSESSYTRFRNASTEPRDREGYSRISQSVGRWARRDARSSCEARSAPDTEGISASRDCPRGSKSGRCGLGRGTVPVA